MHSIMGNPATLLFLVSVFIVGLSQLVYEVTEAPNAVATVCATIEVALGPVSRDTVVYLFTPITGPSITGELRAHTTTFP